MAKETTNRGMGRPENSASPPAGKSWLLGIGIDQYRHAEIPNLRNAVADLRAIQALLAEKYELDEVVILENEQATRSRILWELEKLASKIAPQDKLIIYFSGHGFLDRKGKGHWIPHDGTLDHTADHLPNVLIKDRLEDIDSRHTLLIADSCFSGSVLFSNRKKRIVTLAKELENLKSRWAIASGRGLVDDGEVGEHSPFAASILDYLVGNSLYELRLNEFCMAVQRLTKEKLPKQVPVFGRLDLDDDEGGEYIFRLRQNEAQIWAETMQKGTVEALSEFLINFSGGIKAEEARQLLKSWEAEDEYWRDVLREDKLSSYHDYLGKYPNGRYVSAAWNKLSAKATVSSTSSPTNTFTDHRDGQVYRTVELNGLVWMAENLNFDVGEGCWVYEKSTGILGFGPKEKVRGYGRLYTWEAAKKACPQGWRLPTDEEWRKMAKMFGGCDDDAKDGGKAAYQELVEGGKNGFSALLGGGRLSDGSFDFLGTIGEYWSATENSAGNAWSYYFLGPTEELSRYNSNKSLGFSCRCVQD